MMSLADGSLEATEEIGRSLSLQVFDAPLLAQSALLSSFVLERGSPSRNTFFNLPVFLGAQRSNGDPNQHIVPPVSSTLAPRKPQSVLETTTATNSVAFDANARPWAKGDLIRSQIRQEQITHADERPTTVDEVVTPAPPPLQLEIVPFSPCYLRTETDTLLGHAVSSPKLQHEQLRHEEQLMIHPHLSSLRSASSFNAMVFDSCSIANSPHSVKNASSSAHSHLQQKEQKQWPLTTRHADVFLARHHRHGSRCCKSQNSTSNNLLSHPQPNSLVCSPPGAPMPLPMPFIIDLSLSGSVPISRCLRSSPDVVQQAEGDEWNASASSAVRQEGALRLSSLSFAPAYYSPLEPPCMPEDTGEGVGTVDGKETTVSRSTFFFELPTFGQRHDGECGGAEDELVNGQEKHTRHDLQLEENKEASKGMAFGLES